MGDFYREPDDITRGVTLSSFDFDNIDDVWDPKLSGSFDTSKLIDAPSSIGNSRRLISRFQELQEGRGVPEDPFFFLEQTTQFLEGASPSKAGNIVLDFLEKEIPSVITKVNDKKFTIKAEAFHSGQACQIKVYIYQQKSGCAVEFQRRSGDAIAFGGIYRKASEYLRERMHGGPHAVATFSTVPGHLDPKGPCVQCTPAGLSGEAAEEDLTILLQMPRQAPHLQDEIASTVLHVAEEGQNLAAWCKPEAFDVLVELLDSERFAAAYPAAHLLARLADIPEAQPHFLGRGLLKLVLGHLWVETTGMAVWLQLAHLVHNVVSGHATHMTSKESQETATAIATTLNSQPLESNPNISERTACVCHVLRKALHLLDGSSSHVEEPFAYRTRN
jgi:hypothetical protein